MSKKAQQNLCGLHSWRRSLNKADSVNGVVEWMHMFVCKAYTVNMYT